MGIKLKDVMVFTLTTATDYEIQGGYFLIMPASVTAGAVLAFKADATQGYVNIDTITSPKIVYIPTHIEFKVTFADGSVTITRLPEFSA